MTRREKHIGRAAGAYGAVPAAGKPISRVCPKCEASKGYRCVIRRKDDRGIPYVVSTMKSFHRER